MGETIESKMMRMPGMPGLVATAVLVGSFALLYWAVIAKLVYDWGHDDNYSHGFLIVPIALFFVWERRGRLAGAVAQSSSLGLVVILGSLAVLTAGVLGSELFLTRISIIGTIAGAVLFIFGFRHLRILALPILFLFLMVPVPAIIFNQIAFPLQLLASRFGEMALNIAGIPVLR
jgi:exosortase